MEAMRDAQNNKQGALRIYADVCILVARIDWEIGDNGDLETPAESGGSIHIRVLSHQTPPPAPLLLFLQFWRWLLKSELCISEVIRSTFLVLSYLPCTGSHVLMKACGQLAELGSSRMKHSSLNVIPVHLVLRAKFVQNF